MSFLKKNESAKKSIAFRLCIVLLAVLLLFGGFHFTWKLGYMKQYERIAEKLDVIYLDEDGEPKAEHDESMKRYSKVFGDYIVSLKMPAYLGFGGFISVGDKDGYTGELDADGNIIGGSGLDVALYVWPKLFGGYDLGIEFNDPYNDIWEQVMVNRDLSLQDTEDMDDEYVEYIDKMIQDNRAEIENMFKVAETDLGLSLSE